MLNTQFVIPLRAQDKPVDFQKSFWSSDALKHEYATRYLEQIGAELTPDNIQTVLKNVPLENCKCTPAWKSRGWLADCIYIHPNPNKKADKGRAALEKKAGAGHGSGHDVTVSALLRKDPGAGKPAAKSPEIRRPERTGKSNKFSRVQNADPPLQNEDAASSSPHAYNYNGVKQSFDGMKQKHMFPFNAKRGIDQNKLKLATDPPPLATRLANTAQTKKTSRGGSVPDSSRSRLQQQDDVEIALEEVKRPLQVTLEDVESMQIEFLKAMPFHLLKTHVTNEQKEALRMVLITSTMKRLVGLVSHYLYWTVLRKHIPSEENAKTLSEEDRQTVYLAIAGTFNDVEMQLKKRKHDVVFQLPLVLLSVKVGVETIFRDTYPTWFKLEEEEHGEGNSVTLKKFNVVIAKMFDPDNYNSHVSALESTTEAMRIASRNRHRHTRKQPQRLRDQYYTTSTAMQKLFPRPANGPSRRLLVERGGDGGGRGSRHQVAPEQAGQPQNPISSESQFLTAENRSKLLQLTLRKAQSRYTDSTNRHMKERERLLGR